MSRPLAARRHSEILRRLKVVGAVSVGELAENFGVSHETVRRDLKSLADLGHLDIVHGGAVLVGGLWPNALTDTLEWMHRKSCAHVLHHR